ncbi:hypothetical protein ZYGR_0N03780 [Zygosaccharomyces rouxii]|uniref:ZYRO0D08976p n=2 Tax=Zygosaccharomyces rouxii TaxID=4956 RepID=C5DVS2_ZYGRC|nr:uncharacterized protein ZYRO0D08976g [Zygosaccharomyces rouxii]GAV48973.1 hypothetical protein ZYGR_0N03780 [Zygosaccharomyces rouxii]CAQ43568.1 Uncharacterized protein YNR014W and Uncharacterized protein YMR206W [Zygosaccharomyces rouxii]CAR27891.1 ZYRO0D08976p [Zygosaccharomyces rouxii]
MPSGERPVSVQIRIRHGEAGQQPEPGDNVFTVLDLQNQNDKDYQQCSNFSDFSQCCSRSTSPKCRRVSVCSCPSPETQASPCDRHHHRRNSIAVKFEKRSD